MRIYATLTAFGLTCLGLSGLGSIGQTNAPLSVTAWEDFESFQDYTETGFIFPTLDILGSSVTLSSEGGVFAVQDPGNGAPGFNPWTEPQTARSGSQFLQMPAVRLTYDIVFDTPVFGFGVYWQLSDPGQIVGTNDDFPTLKFYAEGDVLLGNDAGYTVTAASGARFYRGFYIEEQVGMLPIKRVKLTGNNPSWDDFETYDAVPEPGTFLNLALGIAALARRKRR